jgi:hypothetical protein
MCVSETTPIRTTAPGLIVHVKFRARALLRRLLGDAEALGLERGNGFVALLVSQSPDDFVRLALYVL